MGLWYLTSWTWNCYKLLFPGSWKSLDRHAAIFRALSYTKLSSLTIRWCSFVGDLLLNFAQETVNKTDSSAAVIQVEVESESLSCSSEICSTLWSEISITVMNHFRRTGRAPCQRHNRQVIRFAADWTHTHKQELRARETGLCRKSIAPHIYITQLCVK